MDNKCSTVGQGIGSGRTNTKSGHVKVNGLVKKLKKLKKFIPPADFSPVYTLFDDHGHPYNGTRREYLDNFISDSLSRMSELVVTENMTYVKVIDGLVERLSEFAEEHACDGELKGDISLVIEGLRAQKAASRVLSVPAFENFEAKLYREIRKYLEK